MQGYFWNTVLAVNSALWFPALGFLVYSTCMLVIALDWRQFVLSVVIFVALTLSEFAISALAHD